MTQTKRAQFANAEGVYLGWMARELAPAGAQEVSSEPPLGAHDARFIQGEWKQPEPKYCVDAAGKSLGWYSGWQLPEGWIEVSPPEHGDDTYDHAAGEWIDFPNKYAWKRQAEYSKIPVGQQLDALFKFAITSGLVTPDPSKPVDTPEGWVAKIAEIKDTYKKPEKK